MQILRLFHLGLAGALSLSLAACVGGEALVQETTRSLARSAVDSSVQRYLPGVNVSPYTNCVINGATTAELIQLANAATSGAAAANQAWPVVQTITSRQGVQSCLVQAVQSNPAALFGQVI